MPRPISAPGANTHKSLNSVTVSASSISGPFASTIVTTDATFTRIVADGPTNRWNTWNGTPNIEASMRNRRDGWS